MYMYRRVGSVKNRRKNEAEQTPFLTSYEEEEEEEEEEAARHKIWREREWESFMKKMLISNIAQLAESRKRGRDEPGEAKSELTCDWGKQGQPAAAAAAVVVVVVVGEGTQQRFLFSACSALEISIKKDGWDCAWVCACVSEGWSVASLPVFYKPHNTLAAVTENLSSRERERSTWNQSKLDG